MRVISRKRLLFFAGRHEDAYKALDAWYRIAKSAEWQNFSEVRETFKSADVAGRFTIFNIKGNHYRLIVDIQYRQQRNTIRMSGSAIPIIDRESYSSVLANYLPCPIRTEADNERALSQVEALMSQGSLTAAETDLLELLIQLVEHFEAEHYAFSTENQATSLEMLLFLMESNCLEEADLVGVIGSSDIVSEVLEGKRRINRRMAIALSKQFKVDAGLFLIY